MTMTKTVSLHRDDVEGIQKFLKKFPGSDYLTVTVDSSSGIGSVVKVTIVATVEGESVELTKTIVDESSW